MNAITPGIVRFFNTTDQPVVLILNQKPLELAQAVRGTSINPSALQVNRSVATAMLEPVFAQNNTLTTTFIGFSHTFKINTLDPIEYPVNEDLLLYIFYNGIVLCETNGRIIQKELTRT